MISEIIQSPEFALPIPSGIVRATLALCALLIGALAVVPAPHVAPPPHDVVTAQN